MSCRPTYGPVFEKHAHDGGFGIFSWRQIKREAAKAEAKRGEVLRSESDPLSHQLRVTGSAISSLSGGFLKFCSHSRYSRWNLSKYLLSLIRISFCKCAMSQFIGCHAFGGYRCHCSVPWPCNCRTTVSVLRCMLCWANGQFERQLKTFLFGNKLLTTAHHDCLLFAL